MREVYHVLHPVGDVEGEVGGGSAGAPGDVAESWVVGDHAVHAFEEVLHALLRLGREELEGEHRPPIALGRGLDLVDHLHHSSPPPSSPTRSQLCVWLCESLYKPQRE
ncbi:hypothetical protein BHE74_00034780 [Ensete ventricosum]|uniref:Uncharacterized protein n=1 Tax=Ensete ventricosum TaxID=4639 RepID=A0A426YI65_ENSVE|nr:hypothetical protein B296_00034115 [Ensete ventricosum]RWV90016.1 hypothetical protein GW17_00047811 [Ensete ventricosum]RWW58372.1 hypothetical protein BHE74_00034780 [Ensete ventricosum]